MTVMMADLLLVDGTKVGGQPEMLIDGQNGLTFPAGDADGLAGCIVRARAAGGGCWPVPCELNFDSRRVLVILPHNVRLVVS